MATQTTATTTQTTTPEIHSYGSSFGRSWRQKLEARMARTPEQTAALRELGLNTVAAGIAGGIQPALFNPLDCLRVRIQVASAPSAPSTLRTGLVFAQRQGYWAALHGPGLLWNICAVAASQGLRMGLYPTIRDAIISVSPGDGKSAADVAVAGFATGAVGYLIANPLYLLKTRGQAAAQLAFEGKPPVAYSYNSLGKLWSGSSTLVLRGASMTVGHLLGYDLTKTIIRDSGMMDDGPALVALSAVAGGIGASTTSAPADVIMARHMAAGGKHTIGRTVRNLYQEAGVRGFARGWSANVYRYVPTFLVGSMIYEQVRLQLGLGYMK